MLPNVRFTFADIRAPGHNPTGTIAASANGFPFGADEFDAAVVSSVFTHMLGDEIENYVAQLARVLRPNGQVFITALLLDREAEQAIAQGSAAFDFRHPVGPCMTFDRDCPQEGVAFPEAWIARVLEDNGFAIDVIQRGDWRRVRSCEVSHDILVARKVR